MTTKKDQLNSANPNHLASLLQDFKFGDMLRALPVYLRNQAPAAGTVATGNLTTLDVIKLPNDAKACTILRASVRAGGSVGEFTPQAYGATPTTTQVAVTPCGDIAFLNATDAVTDADVVYVPEKGEVIEVTGDLATGVLSLPSYITDRGVIMLLEAEITAGTVTGGKRILVPLAGGGAGLPATICAQLTSNKTTVSFNNATDAGTAARVKLLVAFADANEANAKFDESPTMP
jgi:hypothetical protein